MNVVSFFNNKEFLMRKLFAYRALLVCLLVVFSSNVWAADEGKSDGKSSSKFMEKALEKLPEQKAAEFRATMKQAYEKNEPLNAKIKTQKEEMRAILSAPSFDKAAYVAKSKSIDTLKMQMYGVRSEAFANAAANLSQEERTILAESMSRKRKKDNYGDKKPEHSGKENSKR